MSVEPLLMDTDAIIYPESDGEPMADNTRQYRWIVVIVEGLRALFSDNPLVFVAGNLNWYPVEGAPSICRAPDAMIAFGRPAGDRSSYMQWREGDVAPQVVFEVLSPSNRAAEMDEKFAFFDMYGAEEYYLYDPDTNALHGWQRRNGRLRAIRPITSWKSPLLGITFDFSDAEMQIMRPDGEPFLPFIEVDRIMRQQRVLLQQERSAREQERSAREQAEQRAAVLAAKLRALGIDPDA